LLVSISIGQAVDVLRCLALAAAAWGASGASLVLLAAALRRYMDDLGKSSQPSALLKHPFLYIISL